MADAGDTRVSPRHADNWLDESSGIATELAHATPIKAANRIFIIMLSS